MQRNINIWIIVIAIFISIGRQFYMNVDQVKNKLSFRVRTFITEVIVTSITLGVLFYFVRWIIHLF
jgi:TRAP-type C4-dicarboxylate transport system permease small subunit